VTTAEPLREPIHQYSCTVPTDAPARMEQQERMQLRAAAFRATRVFPGPVGELVSKDLLAFEDFGYVLGGHGLVARLVAAVMDAELPIPAPPIAVA
jgi:hypothetical protein